MRKTLLLTMGDPSGIGPEVLVRCLSRSLSSCLSVSEGKGLEAAYVVIGELEILRFTANSLGLSIPFASQDLAGLNDIPVHSLGLLKPEDYTLGKVSRNCGNAAYRYFEFAVQECLAGKAQGIVTAPLHKEAMNLAGHPFMGHTDILEKLTGIVGPVMTLWNPKLLVSHVTDHIPLRNALDSITPARINHVVHLTWDALIKKGVSHPRIAIAGINPHAGENGLLGREEIEILRPTILDLEKSGFPVLGPFPADTVFHQGIQGRFDAVIAMYHDQGFGPMKTLDFMNGVNCTLGLPFVRTSPDHGTAFEIAGKGVADANSMLAAFALAQNLI